MYVEHLRVFQNVIPFLCIAVLPSPPPPPPLAAVAPSGHKAVIVITCQVQFIATLPPLVLFIIKDT